MRLVEVRFDDMEHISNGWQSFEDVRAQARTDYRCVGVLVSQDKDWTVVASVTNNEDHAFSAFRIPTGAVKSIVELIDAERLRMWVKTSRLVTYTEDAYKKTTPDDAYHAALDGLDAFLDKSGGWVCGAEEPGPITVGEAHHCDLLAGHSGEHCW